MEIDDLSKLEVKGHEVYVSGKKKFILYNNKLFTIRDRESNINYNEDEEWKLEKWKGEPVSEVIQTKFDEYMRAFSLQIPTDCTELFDPCTKEPIKNGDIKILEKRVMEIKKQKQMALLDIKKFPDQIKTRLDLLLFILNRGEKPNEKLLQYNINGQLYESYWDIAFAFGLINEFPLTNDFYMFNGKIENLISLNDEGFSNRPLEYLSSKNVNEGSKSGASDITFVYKKSKLASMDDPCSSNYSIIPSQSCERSGVIKKQKTSEIPFFYFCSSKLFLNDSSKGIDKFDIQNIYTAAKKLDNYERKIILLVKDRKAVEEKIRKAIRKYISDEASYVFGIDDLFASLTMLYDFVHNKHQSNDPITKAVLIKLLNLDEIPKPLLNLRLHQYIATYKITDAVKNFRILKKNVNNKFLVGIVPRGGKTFIAGSIIDKLNPKRVVVLLGAKSETLSQFQNDLFETYRNFNDYQCIDVLKNPNLEIQPAQKYIFIMSVELYKQPDNMSKLLKEIKNGKYRADLFICDEAHLKQTTEKAKKQMNEGTKAVKPEIDVSNSDNSEEDDISDEIEMSSLKELDKQIGTDVPVVYMTGTYMKPLKVFNIPSHQTIIWDYTDIQQAKELAKNDYYFKENFGDYYIRALESCFSYGETLESIQQQYQKFPQLYLLTTQFTPEAKKAFVEQTQLGHKGGFPTISHLFEVKKTFHPENTKPELWHNGFMNPKGIARLVNYLAPPGHQNKKINDETIPPIPSVLKSIDHIAQRIGDRLGFFTTDFVIHSQLWFLPHMQGHSLYSRMCALAGLIFQNEWFRKNFVIMGVSSSIKWNIPGSADRSIQIKVKDADESHSCGTFTWACPKGTESLKKCILDQETRARQEGKGLIILAQNMLNLGISLPCVDIVALLDSGEKVDERIQKMYRALTESQDKKGGYIIDMNYFRTVTALVNYQIATEKVRMDKKHYSNDAKDLLNKVLDVYYVDDDKVFEVRDYIQNETLPELQKMLEMGTGDSIVLEEAGSALNSNITNVLEKQYISEYNDFLGMLKEEEKRQNKLREEGKNVKRAKRDKLTNENNDNDNDETYADPKIFRDDMTEQKRKEAYIDIFKTTLKLGAFGTDSFNVKQLENKLSMDEDLRHVLYDTLIKRGTIVEDKEKSTLQQNFIIDVLVRPGLIKMIAEGRNMSYARLKDSIEDDNKYPVEVEKVLMYIKEHLAPKDTERHKYGEVFTPMTLVNEMLDTLPDDVWQKDSWKWLDPANGMGNYPIATFLRLFYGFKNKDGKHNPGLTKIIPDEKERRKHIVKNMLYMVELNPKNISISKMLFSKLAPGIEPNIIQMHKKDGFLANVDMKFPNGIVNEFDVIMGNPPFNKGSVRVAYVTNKTRKERKDLGIEKDDSESGFWYKFVYKILTQGILKGNGYLLFIHPITWFKPDRAGAHNLILSKQICNLKIFKGDVSTNKQFDGKGKINVAYYLLKNTIVNNHKTRIEYADNKEYIENVILSSKSILMLNYNSIYQKIINKCKIFNETKGLFHKKICSCNDSGIYKLITILKENGNVNYVNSMIAHPDQNKPKILIGGTYTPIVVFDKKGDYGLFDKGQRHYFMGDNLNDIADYFKTKLSTLLLRYIKYEQDFIKPGYFPDIRTINLKKINDDTLADYFGFSPEERIEISKMPHPIHPSNNEFIRVKCSEIEKATCFSQKPKTRKAKSTNKSGGYRRKTYRRPRGKRTL